jgi:hypothetical protein
MEDSGGISNEEGVSAGGTVAAGYIFEGSVEDRRPMVDVVRVTGDEVDAAGLEEPVGGLASGGAEVTE